MEPIQNFVSTLNGIVWGPAMLVLILGVGLYLQFGLRAMPIRFLGRGFAFLFKGRTVEYRAYQAGLLRHGPGPFGEVRG